MRLKEAAGSVAPFNGVTEVVEIVVDVDFLSVL
jgi:hypothetical protein